MEAMLVWISENWLEYHCKSEGELLQDPILQIVASATSQETQKVVETFQHIKITNPYLLN
jgi:hypothetical protein